MLKIKFFVIVIYFSASLACDTDYCKICQNHTLCKYKDPGPSPECFGYDASALLTKEDCITLINKINERRQFIAIGLSRVLPSAANMKKIEWSDELGVIAQRWVDQCDQDLKPDKEDQCRDLGNLKVGQNIATITGSSSGYNIKSFVEVWFMLSMSYIGSVTFYNQTNDYNTNYFTQLIWADSDKVGCGKAKFFTKNIRPILVERLVCNFATRGNVHGKPVYTIGQAATQCDDDMESDNQFPGLCSHRPKLNHVELLNGDKFDIVEDKLSSVSPLATSLLRIRNLNNDSAKQEIDPIYLHLNQKQKKYEAKESHIPIHDDAVKRSNPSSKENFWKNNRNNSSDIEGHIHPHEKGHSRLYHSHNFRNEFDLIHPDGIRQNTQTYDQMTITTNVYFDQDYKKHNKQCTRKLESKSNKDFSKITKCTPYKERLKQCTRGQKKQCPMLTHMCQENKLTTATNQHETCACNILQSYYPSSPNPCYHDINCDCNNGNAHTFSCANLRTLRDSPNPKFVKQNDYYYYDLNINDNPPRVSKFLKDTYVKTERDSWLMNNKQLGVVSSKRKFNKKYSERRRRVPEEQHNLQTFWQMDELMNKNKKRMNPLRYTTLSNRKKKQKGRNSSKIPTTKEAITLTTLSRSNKNAKRITEKYLSFEELLHIRKHSSSEASGRRQYDGHEFLRESNSSTTIQTTPSTETTSEYTPNTPYIRIKHCTRKLTCTWTAASLTDSDGSIIPGGGLGIAGSRTPPGYVEGCTRTSTCTRDYMNRNKMATLPVEVTSPEPEPGDDEDYCERRDLNKRSPNQEFQLQFLSSELKQNASSYNKTVINDFTKDESFRKKRDSLYEKTQNFVKKLKREGKNYDNIYKENVLSYGDLFYYVVSKITEIQKNTNTLCEKCPCNSANNLWYYKLLLILIFFIK